MPAHGDGDTIERLALREHRREHRQRGQDRKWEARRHQKVCPSEKWNWKVLMRCGTPTQKAGFWLGGRLGLHGATDRGFR